MKSINLLILTPLLLLPWTQTSNIPPNQAVFKAAFAKVAPFQGEIPNFRFQPEFAFHSPYVQHFKNTRQEYCWTENWSWDYSRKASNGGIDSLGVGVTAYGTTAQAERSMWIGRTIGTQASESAQRKLRHSLTGMKIGGDVQVDEERQSLVEITYRDRFSAYVGLTFQEDSIDSKNKDKLMIDKLSKVLLDRAEKYLPALPAPSKTKP